MDNNEKMIYDLIKVYLAQMDSAMKISKTICEHSNRNELTGDDVICGLIYRLMKPMSQEEIDDSLQKAEDLLEDSTSEEEEYDCIEEAYEIPKVTRKIQNITCNCDICSDVRLCLINYKDHEVSDDLAHRFKKSIDETCKKHKIYI